MKVLGFSGKAQSGKNTCCNFVAGLELTNSGVIDYFRISDLGQLVAPYDDKENQLDLQRQDTNFVKYLEEKIYPIVKIYSFADALKSLLMNLFEVDYDDLYALIGDKNKATTVKWANIHKTLSETSLPKAEHPSEFLTVRELLQVVGTNLFRNISDSVWTEACLNKVLADQSNFALVCDVRFPNEADSIHLIGGKVIRLTRNPENNPHDSETALDTYKKFDYVLDNKNLNIEEQCDSLYKKLKEWGWINYETKLVENNESDESDKVETGNSVKN